MVGAAYRAQSGLKVPDHEISVVGARHLRGLRSRAARLLSPLVCQKHIIGGRGNLCAGQEAEGKEKAARTSCFMLGLNTTDRTASSCPLKDRSRVGSSPIFARGDWRRGKS